MRADTHTHTHTPKSFIKIIHSTKSHLSPSLSLKKKKKKKNTFFSPDPSLFFSILPLQKRREGKKRGKKKEFQNKAPQLRNLEDMTKKKVCMYNNARIQYTRPDEQAPPPKTNKKLKSGWLFCPGELFSKLYEGGCFSDKTCECSFPFPFPMKMQDAAPITLNIDHERTRKKKR